jgi:acyl carrier protein
MDSNGQHLTPVIDRARAYVLENFLYARTDVQLTETDALLERGIIDSMGVLELITFIQDEFGITVGDDEITEENFGTLASIARYVTGKRAGVGAS